MTKHIDNLFWNAFAFLLLGYAVMGRGFAYMGIAPLFPGEMVLLLGMVCLCLHKRRFGIPASAPMWILLFFAIWCAARTVPFVGRHGIQAIRDGVIWIYSAYAVLLALMIAHDPERLAQLVRRFRKFAFIFLTVGLFVLLTQKGKPFPVPTIPGTGVPIIAIKGGDTCVHLAGVYAFLSLFVPLRTVLPFAVLIPIILGLNMVVRAGILSFAAGASFLTFMRPRNPLLYRILGMGIVAITLMWIFDIRFKPDINNPRDVSVEQLVSNFTSVLGRSKDEVLDGTKEWRMQWWSEIIRYTFRGPYFWTGKGFGVNLANDDGFQVEADEGLRSPHNGHLTILARTGVPGLSLWIILQLSWLLHMIDAYRLTMKSQHRAWAHFFLVLITYWIASLANTSFDVYLEGPMGGIWFWSVFGVGLGAAKVLRTAPHVLANQSIFPQDQPVSGEPAGNIRSVPNQLPTMN